MTNALGNHLLQMLLEQPGMADAITAEMYAETYHTCDFAHLQAINGTRGDRQDTDQAGQPGIAYSGCSILVNTSKDNR